MVEIKKDMNIQELIQKHPKAAGVMLAHGLHCIGCHVSAHESIEQGCCAHGMKDEQIDKMITEINEVLNKKIDTIELTPLAQDMIKQYAKEDGKEGYGLRIAVIEGCCGFNYDMEFVEKAEKDDNTYAFGDLNVFVSKDSFAKLKGSEIDFVQNMQEAGFRIENPNSPKGSCACKGEDDKSDGDASSKKDGCCGGTCGH